MALPPEAAEQVRVLSPEHNGRFLVISLLQGHVFDALLDFFLRGKQNPHAAEWAFDLTLIKLDKVCNVEDSKFVAFMLVAKKRPVGAPPSLALKLGPGEPAESLAEDELKRRVKRLQYETMMNADMRNFKAGQVFHQSTELERDGIPRYSIIARDASDELVLGRKTMCVFVVPLGAEREMDIFNEEKQKEILEQTQVARLIIVILGRGHRYENLDKIKEELDPAVVSLVPKDCANASNIAYLSTSKTIHLREIVFENSSIIVQDHAQQEEDGEEPVILRQMVFQSRPRHVQSEVPLMYRNAKSQGL